MLADIGVEWRSHILIFACMLRAADTQHCCCRSALGKLGSFQLPPGGIEPPASRCCCAARIAHRCDDGFALVHHALSEIVSCCMAADAETSKASMVLEVASPWLSPRCTDTKATDHERHSSGACTLAGCGVEPYDAEPARCHSRCFRLFFSFRLAACLDWGDFIGRFHFSCGGRLIVSRLHGCMQDAARSAATQARTTRWSRRVVYDATTAPPTAMTTYATQSQATGDVVKASIELEL